MESTTLSLQATVVSFCVILSKYYITILVQGGMRIKAGSRPPEDGKLFRKAGEQSFSGLAKFAGKPINDRYVKDIKEKEQRWLRIVANDVENLPIGMVLAIFSLWYGFSETLHVVCMISFATCRVLHTMTYALKLQPHRVIMFVGGVTSEFGMVLNCGMSVFPWVRVM